jgi:hypothetical protein
MVIRAVFRLKKKGWAELNIINEKDVRYGGFEVRQGGIVRGRRDWG